jgi:hypothetical protein
VLTLQPAATTSARPRQMVATIQAEGTTWGGLTHRRRLTALRISVPGWKTADDDVERYPRHPPRADSIRAGNHPAVQAQQAATGLPVERGPF